MKEKKWRIELTEHQLRLIANCVEDCHRFICGQMELSNSTACLKHYRELSEELDKLQPLVTPELGRRAAYSWDGGFALMITSASSLLKHTISIGRYTTN